MSNTSRRVERMRRYARRDHSHVWRLRYTVAQGSGGSWIGNHTEAVGFNAVAVGGYSPQGPTIYDCWCGAVGREVKDAVATAALNKVRTRDSELLRRLAR